MSPSLTITLQIAILLDSMNLVIVDQAPPMLLPSKPHTLSHSSIFIFFLTFILSIFYNHHHHSPKVIFVPPPWTEQPLSSTTTCGLHPLPFSPPSSLRRHDRRRGSCRTPLQDLSSTFPTIFFLYFLFSSLLFGPPCSTTIGLSLNHHRRCRWWLKIFFFLLFLLCRFSPYFNHILLFRKYLLDLSIFSKLPLPNSPFESNQVKYKWWLFR